MKSEYCECVRLFVPSNWKEQDLTSCYFEHGIAPEDFLTAHVLFSTAALKGSMFARWGAAAALDRYLAWIGRPSIFRRNEGGPNLLSDDIRKFHCMLSVAEQREDAQNRQLDCPLTVREVYNNGRPNQPRISAPFHHRLPLVERRGPRRFKSQALKFPDAATVYRPAFISSTRKFAGLSTNLQQPRPNRCGFTVGCQVDYRLNRLMNCARVSRFRIQRTSGDPACY